MTSSKPRIIIAKEANDYVEWQEPQVQGKIASDFIDGVKPPTANQMQNLHKDAYDEGFNMDAKKDARKVMKKDVSKQRPSRKNTCKD